MLSPDELKVLEPTGVLSSLNSPQLLQEFQEFLGAGVRKILVDLKNVTFLDSSGLGTLIVMHSKLRLAGGTLYICSANEQAQGLMDITDFDRLVEIFPGRKEFYQTVFRSNLDA